MLPKSGTRFLFGQTDASRQYDPSDSNRIFKWCLDRVEDTNGNYMTLTYVHNQGQIYLDKISYTGNGSLAPTNYVQFYRDPRTDTPASYATNFMVATDYRLKTIDVVANGKRVRTYKLNYDTDSMATGDQYSSVTGRSLLTDVIEFGSDAQLNSYGDVLSGTNLPPIALNYGSLRWIP